MELHNRDINPAVSPKAGFPIFQSDDQYSRHVLEARAAGSQVIAAHWVCSYLRHVPASPEKVASAPAHFRRHVGDECTWVKGHERHGDVRRTVSRLASRTSIADAVGMGFQKVHLP